MSNWKEYFFEEVIESMQLGTSSLGGEDNFGIPLLKMGNIRIGGFDFEKLEKLKEEDFNLLAAFVLKKGDFLFNTRNTLELVGKSSVWNNQLPIATFNSNIMRIKFKKGVDDFYLGYYFSHGFGWNEFKRIATGSTSVAAIYSRDLLRCKVSLPDYKTQRQIAIILSTADSVIEKTQAAIAKYKAIKQGMLQDLFTRGIDTATGKLRPSYQDAPELYKESKLGWIPMEWNEEIFGEQIELVHGHQFRNYDFTEFGVAVVKIGQVKPDNVDLSNCSFVSADRMEEFRNETIRNGDVLMALTGATLGKACLVSGLSNPVLQNYRVGRFEPKIKENDIDKSFLYYTLTAGELLNQIFNKVNSGAQGNIGKADFEKALFKKPPFTEQKLIAERLNTLNKKLQTEQDFMQKQQQIKAGLMNDLLSGRKKVKIKEEATA